MSADTTNGDIPLAAVESRRDAFAETLAEYDDALVAEVHAAVADADALDQPSVGLSVSEWLDVLETTAGDLYLFASSDRSDTKWYLRHDGEGFVYGSNKLGEMYRGTPAIRQVRSVIENEAVTPGPMAEYPIEQADESVTDSTGDSEDGEKA